MLIVTLRGAAMPLTDRDGRDREWLGGTPNVLSDAPLVPEIIRQMHEACSGMGAEWRVDRPVIDGTAAGGRGFGLGGHFKERQEGAEGG